MWGALTVPVQYGGHVDKDIPKFFGKVLRKLRLEAGLTQEELGFAADLQRNYISSLELGEKQPSLTSLYKVSRALQIKPGHLLDLIDESTELGS